MNKENNYIATIMTRNIVGGETFVFNCSHAVQGDVDEKTNVFTDLNGNEYADMLDPNLMQTEFDKSYYHLIKVADLDKIVKNKNCSLQEKISEYEYLARGIVYFVSKANDGRPFCIPLEIDKLRATAEVAMSKEENIFSLILENEEQIYTSNATDKEIEAYYLEEGEMNPDIAWLISDIVAGHYNPDELMEIKKNMLKNIEDLQSVLDTIASELEPQEEIKQDAEITPEEPKTDIYLENDIDIDIEDLYNKITKTLIGQDMAVRRILVEISRKLEMPVKKKDGILLTGPTGVGKTKLMRLIARYLDRPFYKVDSSNLTCAGWVGVDIEEVLWNLYIKCDRNIEKAEEAIIFFDEIDKKGSSRKDDHSGQGVLNTLLPFIEGNTYQACADTRTSIETVEIKTNNMICIFGGAFEDVYQSLVRNEGSGFNRDVEKKEKKATTEDFVNTGMMTYEFMGRLAVVKLDALHVKNLERVLLESDESALKVQQSIFNRLSVKLTATPKYITAVALEAEKRKSGARGLSAIVDESTWLAYEEVYKKSNRGKYSEVILDEKTVEDSSNFQLVKRKGIN